MFEAEVIGSAGGSTVWDVRGSFRPETVLGSFPNGESPENVARTFLSRMVTIRAFEERLIDLGRQGRIVGAVHTSIGQEATAVGICSALELDDIITGTHRSHGHLIAKGSEPKRLMAEVFGKVTGVCRGRGGSMHLADMSIGCLAASGIVGGGLPLIVGAALASRLRNERRVGVGFFGDGSANQGMVHEAMNLASVWKTPALFVCENNNYAVSTTVASAVATPHLANRALAYGFDGCVTDGQDVLEMFAVARATVARVREEHAPFLIEAKTYRFREHNEGMPDLGYRDPEEVRRWVDDRDPLKLFISTINSLGLLSAGEVSAVYEESDDVISDAVKFAISSASPYPDEIYEDLYARP